MKTMQIPVTVPSLDEFISLGNPQALLAEEVKNGDVYCAHAEFEGIGFAPLFERFLKTNIDRGYRFVPLSEIMSTTRNAPSSAITYRKVPGRTNLIAFQESEVKYRRADD
jgi:hypothetical protein